MMLLLSQKQQQQQQHDVPGTSSYVRSLDFSKTIKYLYVGDSFTEHLIHPLDDGEISAFRCQEGATRYTRTIHTIK